MAKDYKYNTMVDIEPFIMNKFPLECDRFSMIIVSSKPDIVTRNLVQYLVNSFPDEIIIPATDDISYLERKFNDKQLTPDQLKRQLAIIDISPDSLFKNMRTDICTANKDIPHWLKGEHIKNIINPNMILQYVEGCENNFSHTIWLTDSVANLPQVLVTNSQYLFLIDNKHVNDFMKKRYSNDFSLKDENEIFVIGMTITKDMRVFVLKKDKFSQAS